jgi:L-alanine-DL-glutamate epimerase-like enolase superfamily enzyme
VLLTLPNVVEGNQQTAQMMVHDVLCEELPIARGAHWGIIEGPGLGVEVDADAVAEAAGRYRSEGQYLPWQPYLLGREDRA